MSDIPTPIIGLVIAVFVLVFLVVRTRVHALIAMLAAACIAGITGGMSIDKTLTVITQGFGSTLGSIGIVIGLGVMMGRLLEVSGAAEQNRLQLHQVARQAPRGVGTSHHGLHRQHPHLRGFRLRHPLSGGQGAGEKRQALPADPGGRPGGGPGGHPPYGAADPGPLGVAGLFGVDIGAMLLMGMALAIPCVLGIVFSPSGSTRSTPSSARTQPRPRTSCKLPMSSTSRRRKARPCRA